MTAGKIDFPAIARGLLARSESFLQDLFPAGKIRGREFCIGNIQGEAGDSLKINLDTGVGADFASGENFADLINVYAAHHGIGNGEAAKRLSNGAGEPYRAPPVQRAESNVMRPPPDKPIPQCHHSRHGAPAAVWCYADSQGPLHYVARYNTATGKEIVPWTWNGSGWQAKGYPKPRPLYGLDSLQHSPGASVIIVEGEKCVDALRDLNTSRIPVTFSGGASGARHADYSPLAGRDVLLFPDHDEPGRKCMLELAAQLLPIVSKLAIIDHADDDLPEGWDIADTNWTSQELNAWARTRIRLIEAPRETPVARGKPRTKPNGQPPDGQLFDGETGEPIHPTPSAFISWEQLQLQCNSNGQPFPSLANVQLILANHPELVDKIWYDEFHERIFQTLFDREPTEWADHHDTRLTIWIQQRLRLQKIGIQTVQRAVEEHGRRHRKNEVREWLSSLIWDGRERLKHLMSDGFGAEQNDYTAAVGRCFFVGMVARVFIPGCKLDYMPVFEGSQGTNKSTALGVIGGKWFAELHEDITKKDFFQNLPGKILHEISELHAFRRSEVERIKGVISCPSDRYRGSYERRAADHPRRCAFAGTTNRDDWVADDTGARRFWPIACTEANLTYLRANREQLFAEAVSMFNRVPLSATPDERVAAVADWWAVDQELAKEQVELRRDADVWTSPVMEYAQQRLWVSVEEVMSNALKIPVERHTRSDQMRVASILRVNTFSKIQRRFGSERKIVWTREKGNDAQQQFSLTNLDKTGTDVQYKGPFE